MHRGSWLLVAGLLVTDMACAHGRRAAASAVEAQPADSTAVLVIVTNHYAQTMEIYAIGSGTTYHMGTVAPGIDRQFLLRPAMLAAGSQIRFLAQATAYGPRVFSEELQLILGDVVDFEIATQLVGSRATVRP